MINKGDKLVVDKPSIFKNTSDIKVIHTSVKDVYRTVFSVYGLSKYLFKIDTLESICIEKLKANLI